MLFVADVWWWLQQGTWLVNEVFKSRPGKVARELSRACWAALALKRRIAATTYFKRFWGRGRSVA